jgi:tetratricopeptide (TPR) repeat protein
MVVGACLLLLHPLAVTTGYLCIRYGLGNSTVAFSDVALLRWREVRRGFATRQFEEARQAWEAKRYPAAQLAFASGLRNDPDNVDGRLAAARFYTEAGAVSLAVAALEEGFARSPDNRVLAEQLFGLLLATGRSRQALDLLGRLPSDLPETQLLILRGYEVQATLSTEGAPAARRLIQRHPELEKSEAAAPVIARVLWGSKERFKAIELMARHVAGGPDNLAAYADLTAWYLAGGMWDEAEKTAAAACARFPAQMAPRLLRLEVRAERSLRGREWAQEIEQFLADFREVPEAIPQLAQLAGRKGWVELAQALYELGAVRQQNLVLLALANCDALMVRLKFGDALDLLTELEAQTPETATALMHQVRNRQVLCAGAVGDPARTREYARRLAATLRSDPQQFDIAREMFEKYGLTAAVAEFPSRPR